MLNAVEQAERADPVDEGDEDIQSRLQRLVVAAEALDNPRCGLGDDPDGAKQHHEDEDEDDDADDPGDDGPHEFGWVLHLGIPLLRDDHGGRSLNGEHSNRCSRFEARSGGVCCDGCCPQFTIGELDLPANARDGLDDLSAGAEEGVDVALGRVFALSQGAE